MRALTKKRARREIRNNLSDVADLIISSYVKEVEKEFDAAVQRGELLEFHPQIRSPKELLGLAQAMLEAGSDG